VEPITLDHIVKGCVWAINARAKMEAIQIDGLSRCYDQGSWDCGTSCCIWGAASIIAGAGVAGVGPTGEWRGLDLKHRLVASLLYSKTSTPEQVLAVIGSEKMLNMDLSDTDFSKEDYRSVVLDGANLSRSDMEEVDLTGARLRRAILDSADLEGAKLVDADLTDAVLIGANLKSADLTHANLTGANLEGADLRGAILEGTVTRGARLRGAIVTVGSQSWTLGEEHYAKS
jgi:hypothetical protein